MAPGPEHSRQATACTDGGIGGDGSDHDGRIINKNYIKNYNDSIVTIFKNTKPILKSRYEDNQLITQKNFIDNTFKEYRNNGDIKIIEMPGISIEYDYQGKEKSKELFQKNSYKQFIYGILRKEKKSK